MNSLKKIIKKINFLKVAEVLLTVVIIFAPLFVNAQLSRNFQCDPSSGLNCTAGTSVNQLIKTVINWMLGIAFGIAVLFLIIGGFWYITSAGNEETGEKGKGPPVNAITGMVIIFFSYVFFNVVWNLVVNQISCTAPYFSN